MLVSGSAYFNTDVSENSGTPKSSILIGFSIINHPFWGAPIFGNTHIESICMVKYDFMNLEKMHFLQQHN